MSWRRIWLAAVEEVWRQNAFLAAFRHQSFLGWAARYGLAVATVAAAMALRLALTAWIGGDLPTYITFYPAVMVVALLAGFGPGLAATALAGFFAGYWILPPVGQFAIASPADRLGLAIFTGMGLLISIVAELYRRNRDKAAAYDRDAALRHGREALRQQVELIDPVRAEVIAREMLRVVRERGGTAAAAIEPTSETLRRVPAVAGAAVAGVGLLVLVGWMFGLEPLKSVLPGLATMKANTALCFVLAGTALALRERRALRLLCAGIVAVVSALSLAEYVTGADFVIDQLWVRDFGDAQTVSGRMAQVTAISFILTSLSLLLVGARARAAVWAQQAMALAAGVFALAALLGYFYDVRQLYGLAGFSSMALHTATALMLLAVGLVCARTDGFIIDFVATRPGGQLARWLLPAAILLPAIIGWLRVQGSKAGLFEPNFGTGMYAMAMMLGFGVIVWWTARLLNRADAFRRETETQLRSQAELMDQSREALIVREPGGVIRSWNRGAEALYGWRATEALAQRMHALLHTEGVDVAEVNTQLEQTGRWEGELVHTTRDGRRIAVESRQTASRIGDGQVFVLESNRDITERKRAEESLRQLNAGLTTANEELRASGAAALNLMEDAVAARDEAERAIAALRASEERYRTLFNTLLEGFCIIEVVFDAEDKPVDYRFLEVNPAFESQTGLHDAQGKLMRDLAPDHEAHWFEIYGQVALTGEPARFVSEARAMNRWFDVSAYRVGGAESRKVAILFSDITASKQAEIALQTTLQRFYAILSNMYSAVLLVTDEGRVEFANQAFCDNFRLEEAPADLVGLESPDMLDKIKQAYRHPDEAVARIREIVERGQPVKGEELSMQDGGTSLRDFVPLNVQGTSYGRLWLHMDVTEHKRMERDRQAAFYTRSLIEVSLDPLVTIGPDGKITDVNQATEEATGVARQQLIGTDFSAYFTDPSEASRGYRKVLSEGEVRDYALTLRHVSGRTMDVLYNASVYHDEAGRLLGVFAAARDVTEHNQAEAELKKYRLHLEELVKQRTAELEQATEELVRSNKDLDQFASVVSHDLQEPLRTVRGFVQLLQKKYANQLDADADTFIEYAVAGTKRMETLIKDVLTYARVGTRGREPVPIDAISALRQALDNLHESIQEAGAEITHGELPTVPADLSQLAQLFQNLLGNALKFRSETPPKIHVDACREDDGWRFSVRDNGIGIDSQFQEQIFQVFRRLHTQKQYAGTGIGLAVCKKIVDRHGGRIWVESEPGQGATFHFTLPATQAFARRS